MRSVTLVDDEPMALDVLVRAARSWKYECQTAGNAEEALTVLERRPTPILVTDLRMPGRGGVWLVREVQRRWPDTAIIVVTAGHDADSLTQCLDAGAHNFFLKPIQFDEFQHALEVNYRSFCLRRQRERHRRHLERRLSHRTRQLRNTYLSAIDSLVRTLEARDPYLSGHSMRVQGYLVRMARILGLDAPNCAKLTLAGKLHDIGKVGLPESILNKPARLTAEEFRTVQEHPLIGERILSPIIRQRDVLSAIRGHHERYDGSGYPDGLAGERIPYLARVLTVADCYDALTSSRAYRPAMAPREAAQLMRAGAGTQFDPELVSIFLDRSLTDVL